MEEKKNPMDRGGKGQHDTGGMVGKTGDGSQSTHQTGFCSKCGAWRGQLGLEPHPQMYIDHLVEICRELKRVLRKDGSFWLNLGDTFYGGGKGQKIDSHGKMIERSFLSAVDAKKSIPNKPQSNWLQPKQKLMIPSRVATALQDDGWILRNEIVWHKPNHMPSSVKDRLTTAWESVYLFVKARKYYFDLDAIRQPHKESTFIRAKAGYKRGTKQEEYATKGFGGKETWSPPEKGKNPSDVWVINTVPFSGAHFAVFPPKLVKRIVKAGCPEWVCKRCRKPRTRISKSTYIPRGTDDKPRALEEEKKGNKYIAVVARKGVGRTIHETVGWSDCNCGVGFEGGIVLDPFCGSGTTLRVAHVLRRKWIGIDISPKYAEMSQRRIQQQRYTPPPKNTPKLHEFP